MRRVGTAALGALVGLMVAVGLQEVVARVALGGSGEISLALSILLGVLVPAGVVLGAVVGVLVDIRRPGGDHRP